MKTYTHRLGAIESNSSKKSTHGFAALALSNRSLTWESVSQSFLTLYMTNRFFTGADIFVENLWSLYTDKVQSTFLRHS
jgi:hypothetical protein